MAIATILTIFGILNDLFSVAKDAPAVLDEIRSLLAKIEPFVDTAGATIRVQFNALKARAA